MTSTVIGPVVTMCGSPECGAGACPDWPQTWPLGLTEWLDPGLPDDVVRDLLAQELALTAVPDAGGVLRQVPDGAPFALHRADASGPPAGHRPERVAYSVMCTWDAADWQAALAAAPPFDAGAAGRRLAGMRAAGGLRALDEFRQGAA